MPKLKKIVSGRLSYPKFIYKFKIFFFINDQRGKVHLVYDFACNISLLQISDILYNI